MAPYLAGFASAACYVRYFAPQNMRVTSKAPCRVDLAGATLDIWPLYLFHQDAVTVNFAVNRYTSCELTSRDDAKIILRSRRLPCFDVDHQSDFGNADPGAACALLPLITLRPPRIDCSRSRNSSVTAPASTLLRMRRVLMKMMISDLDLLLEVFPNRSPRNLISRRPGMPDRVF